MRWLTRKRRGQRRTEKLLDPFLATTWSCMVCGQERPDECISVYSETRDPFTVNVRYCNDRPACVEGAKHHSNLSIVREDLT